MVLCFLNVTSKRYVIEMESVTFINYVTNDLNVMSAV